MISNDRERRKIIRHVLDVIGISKHKIGYIYLTAVITKAWDGLGSNKSLDEYGNEIAKEGELFWGHMYSAMDYAIEEGWFLGNYRVMECIFGYSLSSVVTAAPSPKKFIKGVISFLETFEKNNSDIYVFLNFIQNGGYTLNWDYSKDCKSKY